MTDNYCSRSCEGCELKEQLSCPGCKEGPGGDAFGYCEVAGCCKLMMQDSCENCNSREACENIKAHQTVPYYIKDQLKNDHIKSDKIKERVKYADKWKKLFYWGLAVYFIRLFTNDSFAEWVPALEGIGLMGEMVCMFASALILLRMSPAEKSYDMAGYCQLGYVGACILALLLPAGVNLLMLIVGVVLYCIGDCKELKAHWAMHSDVDDKMERKWKSLYKWMLGMYGLLLCSLVLLFIVDDIGETVLSVAELGMFSINLLRLVYLHESARLFRVLAKKTECQEQANIDM